jgi:hypothetical protein
MIPAVEALSLPCAKLSDEDLKAADLLESEIDARVRESMNHNGIDLNVSETRPVVIAEVNQRIRRAEWQANWRPLVEEHRLNKALREHKGYAVNLFPSDESYQEYAGAVRLKSAS